MPTSIFAEVPRALAATLARIPTTEISQIYALSFYVCDEDDDPRRPTLTIGYNTTAQWHRSRPRASSADEAKWNFAFWLHNELLVFGRSNSSSAAIITDWIAKQGLSYTDAQEDADFDRCLELGSKITTRFVEAACDLALAMHDQGLITQVFGRAVPIIVHELEYY